MNTTENILNNIKSNEDLMKNLSILWELEFYILNKVPNLSIFENIKNQEDIRIFFEMLSELIIGLKQNKLSDYIKE
tara:strand:+ start:554 stop:781 length:228 start_codon:yes stop_codon:yes gene_type:complete